jgi:undecaprenyl diphosphate synthase
MESLIHKIDKTRLPQHIAIIMDGNGRWAKTKGKPRVFGHKSGVTAVREVSEGAAELGIKHLTLYAFSTENWNRPVTEVTALMTLLVETIKREVKTLNENNIKLNAIGDLEKLPAKSYTALMKAIEDTKDNTRMTLHLALNYSSRWEIVNAVRNMGKDIYQGSINPDSIDESLFTSYLSTKDIPDPELLIRTSGEYRISNYLLWQIAYAELYFTDIYWPDFRKQDLCEAIINFQNRERRFGKISEQVNS